MSKRTKGTQETDHLLTSGNVTNIAIPSNQLLGEIVQTRFNVPNPTLIPVLDDGAKSKQYKSQDRLSGKRESKDIFQAPLNVTRHFRNSSEPKVADSSKMAPHPAINALRDELLTSERNESLFANQKETLLRTSSLVANETKEQKLKAQLDNQALT